MRRKLVTLALFLLASSAAAQLRGPTNQILIPAAGAVQGANGTFFHSDITLTNLRNASQRVQLQWLPQQTTPPSGAPLPPQNTVTITIPANSGISSEDFVTNYLSQAGLGAILITGVTSTDAIDPGALLFATDRIWSPQPGTRGGTVSQTFPAVPVGALNPASQVLVFGQKIGTQYRSNVGVVNLDSAATRTFDILQSSDAPGTISLQTTITVGPMSMVQVPLQDSPATALQVLIAPRPVTTLPTPSNKWVAYVSSVDNTTGDSWSNLAMPLLQ